MSTNESGDGLWKRFCAAEDAFYEARMALFKSGTDLAPFIEAALREPSRIHTGLRSPTTSRRTDGTGSPDVRSQARFISDARPWPGDAAAAD